MFLFKVDGCTNYTVLNEADCANGRTLSPHTISDHNLTTGWYRFRGTAGDRLPDKCVLRWRCGSIHLGSLNGTHSRVAQSKVLKRIVCVVTRKGCFGCCKWSLRVRVNRCTGYYVYSLRKTLVRNVRYCGNAGAGKLN